MAKPETLQFARRLANNASSTAEYLQKLSFDHTHSSSSAVDSVSGQIQGMVKRTQNFLRLMQRYSTEEGVALLEKRLMGFIEHSEAEVRRLVDKKIDAETADSRR